MPKPPRPPCFSVYLLTPEHAPFRMQRSYIGKSVDPFHRQRQHNGEIKGGAWKTKRFRPWQIVCVLTGFANEIAALRFEWIWQHPYKSKLTRDALNQQIKGRKGVGSKETIKRKLLELHTILAEFFDDSKGPSLHFFSDDVYQEIDKSMFPRLPGCIDLHIGKTKCFDDLVLSLQSLSLNDATTQRPVKLNEIRMGDETTMQPSSTQMDVEEAEDSATCESSEEEEVLDDRDSTTSSTVESLQSDTSSLNSESVIDLISPEKDLGTLIDLTNEDTSILDTKQSTEMNDNDDVDAILNFDFRLPRLARNVEKHAT